MNIVKQVQLPCHLSNCIGDLIVIQRPSTKYFQQLIFLEGTLSFLCFAWDGMVGKNKAMIGVAGED